MGKYFNLCIKKSYKDRQGIEKVNWPQVGVLRVNDDGKQFIEIPLLGQTIYVFEAKAKNEAHTKAKEAASDVPFKDDDLSDIPY